MSGTQNTNSVIPAKAGIQWFYSNMPSDFVPALRGSLFIDWIPACAGMTNYYKVVNGGFSNNES